MDDKLKIFKTIFDDNGILFELIPIGQDCEKDIYKIRFTKDGFSDLLITPEKPSKEIFYYSSEMEHMYLNVPFGEYDIDSIKNVIVNYIINSKKKLYIIGTSTTNTNHNQDILFTIPKVSSIEEMIIRLDLICGL